MKDDLSLIFGQRLKELREQRNYTQEDIGSWFNMGKSTVSQWESGRIPHATILVKLASKLGVSIDYLLAHDAKEDLKNGTNQNDKISEEDIELLKQIKKASAEKQKAIELILDIKEQAATATK